MKIPEGIKINPKEIFRHKKILSFVMVFVLVVASFAGGARNASADYYSSYCLGGWQNPQLSGGQPTLEDGATQIDFNENNSSVLENSLASIFCGYFQAPQLEEAPKEVRARFSWYVDFGVNDMETPVDTIDLINPDVIEGEVPEAEEETEDNNVQQVPASPNTPTNNEPVVEQETSNEQGQEAPTETLPEQEPVPIEESEAPQDESPVEEVVPDPISEILLRNFTIPVAHAQDRAGESYGFAQIKYSFNGRDWNLISTVDAGNWRNLSVTVPVDTWEEVQNLQIAVVPLQTIDNQPVVYLDGIWIEVDYRQSLAEAVQEVADDTMALLGNVADGIAGVFGAEDEAVVAESDTQVEEDITVAQDIADDGEVAGLSVSGDLVAPVTHSFRLAGELIPTLRILPWMSRNDLKDLGDDFDTLNKTSPKFVTDANGDLISLSGNCRMQYYVFLMFEGSLDYAERPGEFVLNQAESCVNGTYTISLYKSDLPVTPGKYHILVAEQELDSVWSPLSPLIPVSINQNP